MYVYVLRLVTVFYYRRVTLQVDVTAPVTGQVWDGRGLTDQDNSRDNRSVSAWWRGFSDDQSYIDHYVWCVGTQPGREDVVSCHDVGLHTRTTTQMSTFQLSGEAQSVHIT